LNVIKCLEIDIQSGLFISCDHWVDLWCQKLSIPQGRTWFWR